MNKLVKGVLCNAWTLVEYIHLLSKYTKDGEYKNPTKLMQDVDKKIGQIMKKAYQIPVYRKKFDEANLTPADVQCLEDLKKFPRLTKIELKDWMDSEIAKGHSDNCYINSTSGSSGIPIKVIYGIREKAVANAAWIRLLRIHGYNPFLDRTMAIKVNTKRNTRDSIIQKLGILQRYTYSALETTQFLVQALNNHQPVLLYANKSILIEMILYAKKENIAMFKPRLICSTSEQLDSVSRNMITEYFGDVLFDSYGAEEVSAFTYTRCGNLEKHYITWDTHAVYLDEVQSGTDTDNGRIIVTSLFQRRFPIINYDLRDQVETLKENGIMYIKKICGRMTDWFTFADGTRVGYQPFYSLAEHCPYIFQIRFIQESYTAIRIQLVKNDCPETTQEIEQYMIATLNKLLSRNDLCYTFEWMENIPLDKNMKIKFMVSKVSGN